MSLEASKTVVRRFTDAVWRHRDLAAIDECFVADYADDEIAQLHTVLPAVRDLSPRERLKAFFAWYFERRPDFEVVAEDLIAEGDRVVQLIQGRFTNRDSDRGAPGLPMTMHEINVFSIRDGRIAARFGIGSSRPAA